MGRKNWKNGWRMAIEWSRSHLFSVDSKSKLFWNLSQVIQLLSQSTLKRKLEELSDDSGAEDSDSYKWISCQIQKLN